MSLHRRWQITLSQWCLPLPLILQQTLPPRCPRTLHQQTLLCQIIMRYFCIITATNLNSFCFPFSFFPNTTDQTWSYFLASRSQRERCLHLQPLSALRWWLWRQALCLHQSTERFLQLGQEQPNETLRKEKSVPPRRHFWLHGCESWRAVRRWWSIKTFTSWRMMGGLLQLPLI